MVVEWAAIHQHELMENWERIEKNRMPVKIDPLE